MWLFEEELAVADGGYGAFLAVQGGVGPIEVFVAALGEESEDSSAEGHHKNFAAVGSLEDFGFLIGGFENISEFVVHSNYLSIRGTLP